MGPESARLNAVVFIRVRCMLGLFLFYLQLMPRPAFHAMSRIPVMLTCLQPQQVC